MKNRLCLVFFLFQVASIQAQKTDTTLAWADRLLIKEIPFPVITRLERNERQNRSNFQALNRLTEAYLLNLEFSKAAGTLQRSDSLSSRGSNIEKAYHQKNWSRLTYERSDYKTSADQANLSVKLVASSKNTSVQGDLIKMESKLQLGKTYLQLRRMKESRDQLDEVLAFFKMDSIAYATKLAHVYYYLGLWSKVSDQLSEASAYYERAIEIWEQSESEKYYDLGRCFNNLATVYSDKGDYSKARLYYLKALEIKQKHGMDSLSLAITYNNLGKFYTDFGNILKAEDAFQKSISLLSPDDPRHRERLPEFLNNYGAMLFDREEYEKAEDNFKRSATILKKYQMEGDRLLVSDLSLAGIYMITKNLKQADELLGQSYPLVSGEGTSKRNQALWHLRKANLHTIRQEIVDAEEEYRKALDIAGDGNTLLIAEIYEELGQLHLQKKDWHEALNDSYRSGQIIALNLSENSPKLCLTYNMIGEVYHQMNKYDSALYFLNKAVDQNVTNKPAEHVTDLQAVAPFELISSYYLLSRVYFELFKRTSNLNDLEKSEEFIMLGVRAIDIRRKSLAMANDQLSFDDRVALVFEGAMDIFEEMSKQKNGKVELDKVFYVSELEKSQSLGQALRESNLKSFSNVSAVLRKEEESLRNQIQTLDLQTLRELRAGPDANTELIREYQDDLKSATGHYQQLQDSIRQNLPGYYQLKYNKTLVTVADIQRDILKDKPHTGIIQFSTGDSAIYVQVITGGQQQFYKVEDAPEVKSRVIAIRNQIKSGLTTELYENAAWLYDKLLSKALVLPSGSPTLHQLVIVPDQILCYLPFEVLVTDLAKRKYLMNTYDISYAYSSTLLWQKFMDTGKVKTHQSFIGLAPEFEGGESSRQDDSRTGMIDRFQFQPLTGNRTEVDQIGAGMEKNKIESSVLKGQEATEASFRKLNLKQFDYVHFATHGFVDMDNPQFSGVAFSQNRSSASFDDILFTNEVYEMQFDAQLVCLSSCDSGIGKIYRGEGMIGLAQSFLFAGARNLAVSLWKVDDTATRDLMIQFYGGIKNKSLSAALTSAKRKMAASAKFNHPYYWSSFILIGL